jgi:DeoR family glycerol-3-phosphate regulon repressor
MYLSERQDEIIRLLKESGGSVSSALLTENFSVSVQTIRKDLNELNEQGLVNRVHGGIRLPTLSHNLSFSNRQVIHLEAKKSIASSLVDFLPEGASIFLGIGTTPQQVAQQLIRHPGLTVVTNNLNAAVVLCQNPNIETFMVSVRIRAKDQDVVGEDATRYFNKFQVNYGICGAGGISRKGDLLDFSPEESHITQAILNNCEQRILVADHHKYQRSAPLKSAHLSQVDKLFTDHLSPEMVVLCAQFEVKTYSEDTHSQGAK